MVRQMIERISQHDVSRLIEHDLFAGQQSPVRRHQEFVRRAREHLAAFLYVRVVHGHERVGGRLLVSAVSWRRRQIGFVLFDDVEKPTWRNATIIRDNAIESSRALKTFSEGYAPAGTSASAESPEAATGWATASAASSSIGQSSKSGGQSPATVTL